MPVDCIVNPKHVSASFEQSSSLKFLQLLGMYFRIGRKQSLMNVLNHAMQLWLQVYENLAAADIEVVTTFFEPSQSVLPD